jgi:hypothetical protein
LLAVPETPSVRRSLYVPARMLTVEPDAALFMAFWIVRHGVDKLVPLLTSLPVVET